MHIIIPMSGKGKRFIDAGYSEPKYMLIANDKPIIQHVIDLFQSDVEIPFYHFILNKTDAENKTITDFLTKLAPSSKIYSIDHHSFGPVYAISQIFENIPDNQEIIVSYCDYGTVWDYHDFLEKMRNNGSHGGIATYNGFHPHLLYNDLYGYCLTFHKKDEIVRVSEKKHCTDDGCTMEMTEHVANGTYYFQTGSLLKKYSTLLMEHEEEKINEEFYILSMFDYMLNDSCNIQNFSIKKMLQFGTPRDFEEFKMWEKHFKQTKQDEIKSDAILVLPMAGAGSRFYMFDKPKPLLPIKENPMFVEAVKCLPKTDKQVFIAQQFHVDKYKLLDIFRDIFPSSNVVAIPEVTQGQAMTCEIGITATKIPLSQPILISACDNGVDYDHKLYEIMEADKTNDVIVWAFNNNATNIHNPHMYAWLDVDDHNNIKHVSVKKYFEGAKYCIIGTMYFRESDIFNIGLEEIYKKNIKTNNEYYVDNMLNSLIEKGFNVKMFLVDRYICWGTPNDYRTYNYWYEYFDKK